MSDKLEITDEMLKAGAACDKDKFGCALCSAFGIICRGWQFSIQQLANAYLSERADRANNPGVWDGSPEWASDCYVVWINGSQAKRRESIVLTRELPKTKAREIAERTMNEIAGIPCIRWADYIESAILEYEKAREAQK